jgi:hypothetical protein
MKMRKGDEAKAWNTRQNCCINSLVSSQSGIDLNVPCDAHAQNSESSGNERKKHKN